MTVTDQINFYGQHTEQDPTRRSYSIGDQAAREVVRLAKSAGRVAVDIETAGLAELAFKIKVVIIATPTRSCVLNASDARHRAAAREAIGAARELVFQNSAFDVPPLVQAGIMRIDDIDKIYDTIIYSRMAFTGEMDRHGLGELERRFLSNSLRSQTKDSLAEWAKVNRMTKGKVFEVARYEDPVYAAYAGWDGILTALVLDPVRDAARRQLTDHPFGRYGADAVQAEYLMEREQRVNRIMLSRSARGIRLDDERVAQEQDRLRTEMLGLAEELKGLGVEEATNRGHLATALEAAEAFDEDYPRTAKTGKPSTQAKHLEMLDHPAVTAFKAYDDRRRLFTYLENARLVAERTDGRIHPQVNIHKARTGRSSYDNPALQQFTASARQILMADEGDSLVSIDWASIEPVVAANLAGDTTLIERFEAGEKIYNVISATAGVSYKKAKIVVLAALYGQGIRSLSRSLGTTMEEAKELQVKVASAMPRTDRLVRWAAAWAEEFGKTWTMAGRLIDVDPEYGYKGSNYCLAPDTLILRSDLRHVPASKVDVGDRLVAFDEYPHEGTGNKKYRRMRTAVVEKVSTVIKPAVEVHTSDGRVTVCSSDHLWLVRSVRRTRGTSRHQWAPAGRLYVGDQLIAVGTWEESNSRTAGYLAGLFDGEGCLRTGAQNPRVRTHMIFAQNRGVVMDRFCAAMDEMGLPFIYRRNHPSSTSPCDQAVVSSVRDVIRVLGVLQPERFKDRFEEAYEGMAFTAGLSEFVTVTRVRDVGHVELSSIQTSTRTLIANGYLSHNCVQGSAYDVLSESLVAVDEAGLADGLYLSVHDELVVSEEIAHDVRKIMQTPPERLIELSGRVPKLRTDAALLGARWNDSDACPPWPITES